MTDRLDAWLAGRPSARACRLVDRRGQRELLAVVVDVRGFGAATEQVERRLVQRLLRRFAAAAGSTTSAMREALEDANAWLLRQAEIVGDPPDGEAGGATGTGAPEPAGSGPGATAPSRSGTGAPVATGAGLALLVVAAEDAFLGIAGPAVAVGPALDRVPREGPWPGPHSTGPGADSARRLLGSGPVAAVHWYHWHLPPGASTLLTSATALENRGPDAIARLFEAVPGEAEALLASTFDDSHVAVLVHRPAGDAGSGVAPPPLARIAALPIRSAMSAAAVRARRGIARTLDASGRVLRATLPAETPPGGGRDSWRKALPVIALLLPAAIVALAIAQRARHDGGGALGAPEGLPADPAPVVVATAGSPVGADGTRPLEGLVQMRRLPGDPRDERRLVVSGANIYVLDVPLRRVHRFADDATHVVLERGTVFGADVAGNLVDLFLLPSVDPDGDGAVAALDAAGRIWAVGPEGAQPMGRGDEPRWLFVERADGSDGALFALDRARDQVLRHEVVAGSDPAALTNGRPWLTDPPDLALAADIAVSDGVYVLFQDGRIARFQAGMAGSFGPPYGGPPTPIDVPALHASAGSDLLFVMDRTDGRIAVLGPDGAVLERLARPARPGAADESARWERFSWLHDAWWDESTGRLYAVDGATLLGAPYDGPSTPRR